MAAAPIKRLPDRLSDNTSAQSEANPHVAALATGGFLIGNDRFSATVDTDLAKYNATGSLSAAGPFVSTTTSTESALGLYGLASGNVLAAWTDTPTATSDSDIRAVLFNPEFGLGGSAFSFLVNAGDTAGNQVRPEAVEIANNFLAFAWIDVASAQIRAATADAFGHFLFVQNILVSTTPSSQDGGAFDLGLTPVADSLGRFAVSWRTDSGQEHFRIMDLLGNGITADITVASSAGAGDIIQLSNGTIEVVYATSGHISGRAYDTSGNALGAEFAISTSAGDHPAAAALNDGRFMVVYEESGDIFGRIMNRDGSASTDEFRVNTDPALAQAHPSIDTLVDGQVVVAWEDSRTGAGDIYYTVLDPRQTAVNLSGTNRNDSFVGTDFNDTLTGGLGGDRLNGGLGSDTFVFNSPADGQDFISDFQKGPDRILLGSNFVSEGGGPHPLSGNVHFEYGAAASTSSPTVLFDTFNSHTLKWDADGTGPAAPQSLTRVSFADASDVFESDTINFSLPGLGGYSVLGTGDFNHQGGPDSDIVLRNNSTGAAEIWFMGGGHLIADFAIGNLTGYSLAGTGDFNHDGTDDMLWRNNTSGVVEAWLMQDGVRIGDNILGNLSGYTALGTGDFNQDGNTDILWQNNASGLVDIWFMGGGHMIADYNIGNLTGYSLLGVGDFNGDHTSDLVWRNNMSGVTETWLIQQGVRVGGSTLGNLAGYQLLDTGDLNHDGTDDLVWRASTGATSSWAMRNGVFQGDEQNLFNFPLASNTAAAFGDFTGDGGKDVLFLNSGANTTTIVDIEHHSLTASDFLIV